MQGMLNEAMEILTILEEYGYEPDVDNFNSLIFGLGRARRSDLALGIYEKMIEKGHIPTPLTYVFLVEGIIGEEEKELALYVLNELHSREVISRNTLERFVIQHDLEGFSL